MMNYRRKKLTLKEVEAMPVIRQGQYDNLLYDAEGTKVWHSRLTIEDGMPYNNMITIEKYDGNTFKWVTIKEYEAK